MTPSRFQRIKSVLQKRQPDLTVIADEVHKGRNIAAILRTCDAVGIDRIYSVVPDNGYRPYRGTALGTQKWVEVELCDSVEDPVHRLAASGFQLVATTLSAQSQDFRTVDYTLPTALILGSERAGVSAAARMATDKHITIPMVGMTESYNVSVACAVILAEAQRQRQLAGLYESRRLTDAEYAKRFFQWAHPEVARFCDREGLAYPQVDEADGEIVDPATWYRQIRSSRN